MALKMGDIEARDLDNLFHPWTHLGQHKNNGPMVLEHAEGVYMYDNHGKQYLEGLAGLWCTALGYGNEELAQAAYDQIKQLSYAQLFASKSYEVGIELAEKVNALIPIGKTRVLFGNSGSDANDTQIKLAWYYNNVLGRPEKKKIISRVKAYHGITLAAGSLTGLPPAHNGFDLPIREDRFLYTDTPHHYRGAEAGESETDFASRLAANLENMIQGEGPETIAAFIAEPIMGAGGVILPPETYFKKIQEVLNKYDILFIDDEVICGFGRTGSPFGFQSYNLAPDSVSVAKAITSAYQPLSAVVVKEEIYQAIADASDKMGIFGHGYTWGGHPVSCAVALKTLEIYERDKIFDKAAALAPQFQARLAKFSEHPMVGEARGMGLIGAVELVSNKTRKSPFEVPGKVGGQVLNFCHANGLICRAIGDVIAFCPPLIITSEQIDELFDKFEKAMSQSLDWAKKEGVLLD